MALMPFVPAGYPDLAATAAVLPALADAGADLIEVGIPFSDPIADGPTIQEAFSVALAAKLKVADILATIAQVRSGVSVPLVAMVSYSIVFRHGTDRFIAEAREAGFDGLILPDLPPPEADAVCVQVRQAGLDTVLLVAPTTSPSRRQQIVNLCSGFVYYLSISGITGERDALPADLADNLRQLRQMTQVPVCVGFGISKPAHLAQLAGLADGAIVGSALVRRMKDAAAGGPVAVARAAADFCKSLVLDH